MENMKLVFMGSSPFGIPALEALIRSKHEVATIYTQPSKRAGRGLNIQSSPMHQIAESNNKIIRTPYNLSSEAEKSFLEKIQPDIGIVVSYGMLIPDHILSIPKYGFLNVHPSLLPRWRGAAPIQRSLINGDKITGISIIKLDTGLDTGDICSSLEVAIDPKDDFQSLSSKLSNIGTKMILDSIDDIINKNISYRVQSEENISYAEKIDKSDTKISFENSATDIINLIRGLSPNPGAWFTYNDGGNSFRVKILSAEIMPNNGPSGELLDDQLLIACGEKSIKPSLLQREGKKIMSIDDFLRGIKMNKGVILNKE